MLPQDGLQDRSRTAQDRSKRAPGAPRPPKSPPGSHKFTPRGSGIAPRVVNFAPRASKSSRDVLRMANRPLQQNLKTMQNGSAATQFVFKACAIKSETNTLAFSQQTSHQAEKKDSAHDKETNAKTSKSEVAAG